MPGRGAPGAGAPGIAGGRVSRATRSARGGTTGRAAGCPARFGFAGGRSGLPPPAACAAGCPTVGAGAEGAGCFGGGITIPGAGAAGAGRIAGRGGAGKEGALPGLGAPGVRLADGGAAAAAGEAGAVLGASAIPGGSGCRGPERICPGLAGGGTGRDGITGPRLPAAGGTAGWPVASGGRKGNAGRTGAAGGSGACVASFAGSVKGTVSVFAAWGTASGAAVTAGASVWCPDSLWVAGSRSSPAGSDGSAKAPDATRRRICNATSSSSELECVFFSVTPSSGNISRMMLGLTSSSRASSLMRILLIR